MGSKYTKENTNKLIETTVFPTKWAACHYQVKHAAHKCHYSVLLKSAFNGSLRRSERLLKISKVSYAWKTYRKHFSRSLDFVEIIPRPQLEPL